MFNLSKTKTQSIINGTDKHVDQKLIVDDTPG